MFLASPKSSPPLVIFQLSSVFYSLCLLISYFVPVLGMYSRRQAEKVIMDGRVKVNYELVTAVTYQVMPQDKVFVDDIELRDDDQVDRPRLWMVRRSPSLSSCLT
jgi:hypothetical protein